MQYTDFKVGDIVCNKKFPNNPYVVDGIHPPKQGFPNGIIDVQSSMGSYGKDPADLEMYDPSRLTEGQKAFLQSLNR